MNFVNNMLSLWGGENMELKVATLIRIEEEIFEEIKDIAREENRSFNKQVEYILKAYIEQYKNVDEKNTTKN